MKSKFSLILMFALLGGLLACAGQGAAPEGLLDNGSTVGGPVGGGQGQPTIGPGADHQPGVPVEGDDDSKGPNEIAAPGQQPEATDDPNPGFEGPNSFKN